MLGAAAAFGQSWTEYRSDNFVLYSDLSQNRATNLVEELELFRATVMLFTGVEADSDNRRLQVFVFRKKGDFSKISGHPSIIGFYYQTNAGPRMVMGPGRSRRATRSTLFHEYVHHVLGEYSDMQYPRWYNEGLAEVLGATELRSRSVVVGAVDEGREATLLALEPLGIETLIDPGDRFSSSMFNARFYATAWLFTHYLQIGAFSGNSELKTQTQAYLERFADGDDPVAAFEASFGMRPESMNARVRQYRRQGSIPVVSFQRPDVEVTIQARKLDISEEAFILGDLAWRTLGDDLAMEYLLLAEADSPSGARALSARAVIEHRRNNTELAEQLSAQALASGGADSTVLGNVTRLSWERYSASRETGGDGGAHLSDALRYGAMAVEADADNMEAHRFMWLAYAARGEPVNAARSMVAAYQLHPSSVPLNLEIGKYLIGQGNPELSRQFLEYVLGWAHDTAARGEAERLLAELNAADAAEAPAPENR